MTEYYQQDYDEDNFQYHQPNYDEDSFPEESSQFGNFGSSTKQGHGCDCSYGYRRPLVPSLLSYPTSITPATLGIAFLSAALIIVTATLRAGRRKKRGKASKMS